MRRLIRRRKDKYIIKVHCAVYKELSRIGKMKAQTWPKPNLYRTFYTLTQYVEYVHPCVEMNFRIDKGPNQWRFLTSRWSLSFPLYFHGNVTEAWVGQRCVQRVAEYWQGWNLIFRFHCEELISPKGLCALWCLSCSRCCALLSSGNELWMPSQSVRTRRCVLKRYLKKDSDV